MLTGGRWSEATINPPENNCFYTRKLHKNQWMSKKEMTPEIVRSLITRKLCLSRAFFRVKENEVEILL